MGVSLAYGCGCESRPRPLTGYGQASLLVSVCRLVDSVFIPHLSTPGKVISLPPFLMVMGRVCPDASLCARAHSSLIGCAVQPATRSNTMNINTIRRALAATIAAAALSGCTTLPPGFSHAVEPSASVMASCPPLSERKQWAPDGLALRVAEAERWYEQCRYAALGGKPARAPMISLGRP